MKYFKVLFDFALTEVFKNIVFVYCLNGFCLLNYVFLSYILLYELNFVLTIKLKSTELGYKYV